MKINLSQLEARLQSLIEGSAARVFPAGSPQNELGTRLVQAMRANIHPQSDGSIWAPNVFSVIVPPVQAQRLESNPELLEELARLLYQAGQEAGLVFPSPPIIKIQPDPSMGPQNGRILAQFHLEHLMETYLMSSRPGGKQEDASHAFLIINGTQVYPLDGSVINLGRSPENTIILDDPRVSRQHAQLRYLGGRYVIFDLNSTGGTFVNQQPVTQSSLFPGDVISLAGVPIIFGQDQDDAADQTQQMPPSGQLPDWRR